MRLLMCAVLAVFVFLSLGAGYLIYPGEVERAITQDDSTSVDDAMVFFEFVSVGVFAGFYVAGRIYARLGSAQHTRWLLYDRNEVKYVLLAINGLLIMATGSRMLEAASLHGWVHVALGIVLFLTGLALGVRNQIRAGNE
jgi:hypothetical protein